MTFKEILIGLASLPAALKDIRALQQVGTVSIAALEADDVIIVETDKALPQRGRENITETVHRVWPNHRVVVWDSGLRMRVITSGETRQSSQERPH